MKFLVWPTCTYLILASIFCPYQDAVLRSENPNLRKYVSSLLYKAVAIVRSPVFAIARSSNAQAGQAADLAHFQNLLDEVSLGPPPQFTDSWTCLRQRLH